MIIKYKPRTNANIESIFNLSIEINGIGIVSAKYNEIKELNVKPENLLISGLCPTIEPVHLAKDKVKYQGKLGTTGRGIGPAYSDFYARDSILFKDAINNPQESMLKIQEKFFDYQTYLAETYIFRVQDGETEAKALSRIAFEISLLIEESWKLDNILELDSSDNLIAEISLNELHEWVEIRRRLAEIAFVKNMELVTLSRMQATVRLVYFGSPKQLKMRVNGFS